MTIGRLLKASGFVEVAVTGASAMEGRVTTHPAPGVVTCITVPPGGSFPTLHVDGNWADVTYEQMSADYQRVKMAAALADDEHDRARMAGRLRLETALDNDAACGVAAGLHAIGKDVDWFVRMIPSAGAHTAARAVILFAKSRQEERAYWDARYQAEVVSAVLHGYIDVSDSALRIDLPAWGGEFPGDRTLWEKLYQTQIVGRAEPAAQPKDYLRHDPTKTHRRTKRRARR